MNKVLLVYEDYSEMMNVQSVLKKVGFDSVAITSEFSMSEQILSFNPDVVIGCGKGAKVSTVGVGRRLKEMPRWTGKTVLIFPVGLKLDPQDLVKMRMDMALEAPVEMTRLLQVLSHLTGSEHQELLERMMKSVAQESAPESVRVGSESGSRDDESVYVQGGGGAAAGWKTPASSELEEFNRLMGVPSAAPAESSAQPPVVEVEGGHLPWKEVLEVAKSRMAEKMEAYRKALSGLPAPTQQQLRRKDTKKALKKMRDEWSEAELASQDELRRQFTKALFKKKD